MHKSAIHWTISKRKLEISDFLVEKYEYSIHPYLKKTVNIMGVKCT